METDKAALPTGHLATEIGIKLAAHCAPAAVNGHQSLSVNMINDNDENDLQSCASNNIGDTQSPAGLSKSHQLVNQDSSAVNGDNTTRSSTNTKSNSQQDDLCSSQANLLDDSNCSSADNTAMDTTEAQQTPTLESPVATSAISATTNIEAISKGSFFGVLTAVTPSICRTEPNCQPDQTSISTTQPVQDQLSPDDAKNHDDTSMESSENQANSPITEDPIIAEKSAEITTVDMEVDVSKEGNTSIDSPSSTLVVDNHKEIVGQKTLASSQLKDAASLRREMKLTVVPSEDTKVPPSEDGDGTQEEEGQVTQEEEGQVTQEEEGQVTQEEEGQVTQEEEGRVTQEEEGQVTQEEEGQVTQEEEGQVTQEEEGQVTQEEKGQVTQSENDGVAQGESDGVAQRKSDELSQTKDSQATRSGEVEVIQSKETNVLLSNAPDGKPEKAAEKAECNNTDTRKSTTALADTGDANTNCHVVNQKASAVNDEVTVRLSGDRAQRSLLLSRPANVKPVETKSIFNVKPAVAESPKTVKSDTPSAQDIKDGHAYLRPTPKFLYQLGLSVLREVVYEGLADHVGTLRKKGDSKYSEEQFESLQKSLANLRKDNKHLKLPCDKTCKAEIDGRTCRFKTESELVLETHLSQAHMNRSNRYVCARCSHHTPHMNVFRNHMLERHGWEATADKPFPFYPCKLCFYETNIAVRMQSHQNNCTKSFQIGTNLKPTESDKTPVGEDIFKKVVSVVKSKAPSVITMKSPVATGVRHPGIVQPQTAQKFAANIRPAVVGTGTLQQIKINSHVILPQKAAVPQATPIVQQVGGTSSVVEVLQCEICGGYIQGLQALRVHMQWTHNINIAHINKPQFQCVNASCRKTFWTVQGLGKHSSACKAAVTPQVKVPLNPSCCFICSKPYQTSQVEHLLGKHLNDLKKMVEIKKCFAPRCSPFLFGSVENLQFHLAKEHRLKMTGLSGLATANANNIKFQPFCSICKLKFGSSTEFAKHCAEKHVHKCDLCGAQCSTPKGLQEHEALVHPFRFCLACDKNVKKSNFEGHVMSVHSADKCKLQLKRLSGDQYQEYSKKPKLDNWA